MDSSKAVANTAEAGGPSTISVVVTTVTTPASLTTCESPANTDTTRRRVSPIKLVGLGGLERQNYCCGHWFPSSKSYHRHLAEKAVLDLTHEMRLIELGMLRCVHCSMWVHVDSMSGHLRKSHGIVKVNKTSKIVHSNATGERTGNNRDALKTATNFVIKVSGQSAVRTSNGDISNSNINTMAKSGTVKLVTTSSGSLYHKVHQFHHTGTPGMGKVIVHQSTSNSLPIVNMGSRIVMKSVGSRNVIPLSNARQILPLPSGSQAVPTGITTTTTATTTATATSNINGITTVQITGGNMPPSCSMSQNITASNTVEAQEKIQKINGQNLKLIKKIANVKSKNKLLDMSKNKLLDSQAADCSASTTLSACTKTKEKGKSVSSGETGALKPSQTKKSRKQVLKPNLPDVNCVAETPSFLNVKLKKRGRKRSVEPGEFNAAEANGSSPTLNHKGYRRKLKETPDNENYTPKTTRQAPKGVRRGWRKKRRGPGRPRKIRMDETPDLSEIDSLFDELNKEDLENEPVIKTKKEEENVPTVELDLFTLPSLNEQMSVLLTEPHNPNFKVYASMDAIFVGDSALGDVTNQIGYVTDANNVVYVNPSHFLFPNVEDLENFVPSPILTVKGSKVGFTPARQMWKLNSNKALTPVVLRENKFVNLSTSKETSSCGVSSEKMNLDEKESQISSVTQKQKVSEKVLKCTNIEASQGDNILHVKPLRIAKADTRQNSEYTRRDSVPSTSQSDAGGATALSSHRGPSVYDAEVTMIRPKVDDNKTQRRQSHSQVDDEKEQKKDIIFSPESFPLESIEGDISAVSKCSLEQNHDVENGHQSKVQNDGIASQEVELHDLKSPVKLKEASPSSSEETEVLKSPISKNFEEATREEETTKAVSPCKYDSENSTKLERCVSPFKLENDTFDSKCSSELAKSCASPLKSKNLLIVSPEMTEDAGSPLECKNKPMLSPGSRVNRDACTARMEKEEALTLHSPMPETTKISSEKFLSISRRRRSRTKSAETVMNSAVDTQRDAELGCNDKDSFRYRSRRKARQLSDSSVILKETKLDEGDRLSIADLRERLRMDRLPTRLRQRSGKDETEVKGIVNKSDIDSLIDQNSYPVTPTNTKPSLLSTDNSAIQSDSAEGETKSSLETFCRVTPSGLQGEAESKTPVKIGRQRRKSSKLIESLDIEPLEANIATDAVVRTPSLEDISEKCIKERLIDQEKAEETISGRERHPSSKLESMAIISHSPKRVSSPNDAEQQACTCHVDEPSVVKQQPDADIIENPPSLPEIACVPLTALLEKSEEGSPPHKENKKEKSPKTEELSTVSPLRETEFSPLREWHGRGAKLKAQVLIQDQQAGVTDSQIIPSSSDISTHSRDTTPAANNSVWSSSPKKISSSNNETKVTPTNPQAKTPNITKSPTNPQAKTPNITKSPTNPQAKTPNITKSPTNPQAKTPNITKSPTSPKVSKSPRSPKSVQDREWQARGAKLKAQVMISDQQRSVEEFSEEISSQTSYGLSSPPAKKMKAEVSPGTTRDIRTFFTVKKSQVHKTEEEGCQLSSLSQTQASPVPCKKKTNKYSDAKNDIRSYLSSGASGKRKPLYSPQKSSSKIVKIEETSLVTSPKRSPKKQDIKAVLQLCKESELLETKVPQVSDTTLPRASYDFEGFDRCSRQSGLRSKSLMRIVSLLSMKRWYHLGKYPFPVDQLCDWDDEVLTSMVFDSN